MKNQEYSPIDILREPTVNVFFLLKNRLVYLAIQDSAKDDKVTTKPA